METAHDTPSPCTCRPRAGLPSVPGGEVLADTCAPEEAFETLVDAIRTNDVDLIDQLVLDSPDAVFFGTDGAERWVGHDAVLAAYGAQLAAFQTTRVDLRDKVVQPSPACDAAVFSAVWDWHISAGGQNVVLEAVRLTGALFRERDTWHVAQFHFSMPVGGERRDPDQVKRDGWHEQGLFAVMINDSRLT